jgi:hypothetical protein
MSADTNARFVAEGITCRNLAGTLTTNDGSGPRRDEWASAKGCARRAVGHRASGRIEEAAEALSRATMHLHYALRKREDSPGIPPGQAAGERLVAAQDAEEEKEPGPGDGVTSPARASDEAQLAWDRGDCKEAWRLRSAASNASLDAACGSTGPCDPGCPPCDARDAAERTDDTPPSTWLPPGASEPEPGDPSVEDDGAEPAGRWSGPDTFEPIEQAIRDGAPEHDERAEACVGRVRARLFGKDGGT